MDLEKFAEMVLAEVRKKTGDGFETLVKKVTKNNNVKLTAIVLRRKESSCGPCIYLEEYFEEYRKGKTRFEDVAGTIRRELLYHGDDLKEVDTKSFGKWDAVKARIYARLVNREGNQEQLKTLPHRQLLDLAVVYYIKVEVPGDASGYILIRDGLREMWGQEEESLYRTALANIWHIGVWRDS